MDRLARTTEMRKEHLLAKQQIKAMAVQEALKIS